MGQNHLKLKRAIERAVTDACKLNTSALWFGVDELEVIGRPAERIKVWATLRFLSQGAPFCCGEPGCHLCLFGDRLREVEEQIRAELNLSDAVAVEFADRIAVHYDAGVTFRS